MFYQSPRHFVNTVNKIILNYNLILDEQMRSKLLYLYKIELQETTKISYTSEFYFELKKCLEKSTNNAFNNTVDYINELIIIDNVTTNNNNDIIK